MKELTPAEVAYIATTLALELAKCKDIDELTITRNIVTQISSTLQTIISQKLLCEKLNKDLIKDPIKK